jgi:hypothetical protein
MGRGLGRHYKGRVKDWSTWNEPDGCKKNTPAMLADNNIRTAENHQETHSRRAESRVWCVLAQREIRRALHEDPQ